MDHAFLTDEYIEGCVVCLLRGGALTADCPGALGDKYNRISSEVRAGRLDYRAGAWVPEQSSASQEAARRERVIPDALRYDLFERGRRLTFAFRLLANIFQDGINPEHIPEWREKFEKVSHDINEWGMEAKGKLSEAFDRIEIEETG
jgi:hypothetical protein